MSCPGGLFALTFGGKNVSNDAVQKKKGKIFENRAQRNDRYAP